MNIFDLPKQYLTNDVLSRVASETGENESNITKAFSALIPIILGSVVDKNSSTDGLLHTLKSFGASRGLNSLSTQTADSPILSQLINLLFGANQNSIIDKIADFAGISTGSSSKLFNLASEASLGSLGKYANDNNLGENEFSSLLDTNKNLLSSILPAGLGLGALGIGKLFGSEEKVVETEIVRENIVTPKSNVDENIKKVQTEEKPYVEPVRYNESEEKSSILKWLLPLLLLLLGAFLLWKYVLNNDKETTVNTTNQNDTVLIDSSNTNITTASTKRTYGEVDLDGVKLKAYQDGLESQIIAFIKSPEYPTYTEEQLKEKWINFDNVNFVFGKTDQLEGDSQLQIENLAQILKKYPESKIKIGAYTDNVGNAENNKELSQKRADFLKSSLEKLGVGSQVVSAEGYGAEFATVPAEASDEERAVDRKMSLRFTK